MQTCATKPRAKEVKTECTQDIATAHCQLEKPHARQFQQNGIQPLGMLSCSSQPWKLIVKGFHVLEILRIGFLWSCSGTHRRWLANKGKHPNLIPVFREVDLGREHFVTVCGERRR